jgi:hypothetical protein
MTGRNDGPTTLMYRLTPKSTTVPGVYGLDGGFGWATTKATLHSRLGA